MAEDQYSETHEWTRRLHQKLGQERAERERLLAACLTIRIRRTIKANRHSAKPS